MKPFILLVLSLMMVLSVPAQPARIILLRHAEKQLDEDKAGLSLRGQERAMALVPFLTRTPELIDKGLPVALFATRISRRGTDNHTHETLAPLAAQLGLKIKAPYAASDYQALAHQLLTDAAYQDKTVLICWTHTQIPGLVAALGISPEPPPWDKRVFDRVLLITY